MATKKSKTPLAPKVTFVGGKWYNEKGDEVPKPQRSQPTGYEAQGTGYDPGARGHELQGRQQEPLQRYNRPNGCTCAKPENTGHVPGCKLFDTSLYACEKGNRATVESLAKLANTTLADLERRRLDYAAVPECWDLVPIDTHRRRCWRCPYWERYKEQTPFDHQKRKELDVPPKALFDADDDLPF